MCPPGILKQYLEVRLKESWVERAEEGMKCSSAASANRYAG